MDQEPGGGQPEDINTSYNIRSLAANKVERFPMVQTLFIPPANYNVAPISTVPVVRLEDRAPGAWHRAGRRTSRRGCAS